MKRWLFFCLTVFLSVQVGCVGKGKVKSVKALPQIKKVAVVSLAVSDWGGSVKGGGIGGDMNKTLQNATNKMLKDTESRLSKDFKVVKASSFLGKKAYKKQTEKLLLTAYVPEVKGKRLGVFTKDSRSLKRGELSPEKAKALCKTLGVDAVCLVFSEWTVKTGGFVPLTKAVSKNIVSLWDANGQKVFTRRVDKMGSKVIGGMGIKAVTKDTVNEWTGTYNVALDTILR